MALSADREFPRRLRALVETKQQARPIETATHKGPLQAAIEVVDKTFGVGIQEHHELALAAHDQPFILTSREQAVRIRQAESPVIRRVMGSSQRDGSRVPDFKISGELDAERHAQIATFFLDFPAYQEAMSQVKTLRQEKRYQGMPGAYEKDSAR